VENSSRPYVLKEELIQLAAQFAGMDIGVYGFDPNAYHSSAGTGAFCSSRINFFGYNLKKLKEITAELEKTLEKNPRVKEIRTVSGRSWWSREGSSENILKIDQVALRKYDVDPEYLYFHLGTLVHGAFGVPLKIRSEGREIALSFKSPQTEQMDLRTLMSSLIRTKSGEFLSLGEISILEEKPLAGSIDRENQQFMQTALWEFRGPAKAEENFRKSVFQSLHLPPGFSASMEESWLMTGEEKGQIRFAIFFSLAIIFMILAALYESLLQPLFILLAVPLALIGVFIAFVIARYPFDSSAYIGIILLGGIVVNNAILLVDHINLKRRQGLLLLDAVIQGTRDRVRPIFMTTCTTVFGILPLLLIPTEGRRQIWSALALCTVGGLVSSTIFILIVIPIFYLYGNRLRLRILGRLRK
jgi:HAE1 family hydrophobic/amphiphilic exporter-1